MGDSGNSNKQPGKLSQETSSTSGFQDYHQVLQTSGGQSNNHNATGDSRQGLPTASDQQAASIGKLPMKVTELGPQATSTSIKKQLLVEQR